MAGSAPRELRNVIESLTLKAEEKHVLRPDGVLGEPVPGHRLDGGLGVKVTTNGESRVGATLASPAVSFGASSAGLGVLYRWVPLEVM